MYVQVTVGNSRNTTGCDLRVVVYLKDVVESDNVWMIELLVNVVLTKGMSATTCHSQCNGNHSDFATMPHGTSGSQSTATNSRLVNIATRACEISTKTLTKLTSKKLNEAAENLYKPLVISQLLLTIPFTAHPSTSSQGHLLPACRLIKPRLKADAAEVRNNYKTTNQ